MTVPINALGRRIVKKIDTDDNGTLDATTHFYYNADWQVLLETDVDTSETDVRIFVYGNYIDEVLMMIDLDSNNGITDGVYYYVHDHLHSPKRIKGVRHLFWGCWSVFGPVSFNFLRKFVI